MITLGINVGYTKQGRPLNDGGACLVKNGKVLYAIQEERITRQKYDCGFEKSIEYICLAAGIAYSDIDTVVVSSCVDVKWTVKEAMRLLNLKEKYGFNKNQVQVLGHHLSHAYSGFIPSGFSSALVCVMDNNGNKLKDTDDEWVASFERTSFYKAYWKDNKPVMKLIARDATEINQIGYGEAYRYFTHHMGWDSYKHAGKLMGLSAYGDSSAFKNIELFETKNNQEICLLDSSHKEPEKALNLFFAKHNKKIVNKLDKGLNELKQEYANLAHFIQKKFEESLERRIINLVNQTGLGNVVICGGVGLNCLANTKISDLDIIKEVYVPCCPGDEGQSMGNALFGHYTNSTNPIPLQMQKSYFGKTYSDNWQEYAKKLDLTIIDLQNVTKQVAQLISEKKIIGWFQSRSEFGPRALGNRSILADPRQEDMQEVINKRIKFRELFRPFAPTILAEYQKEYLESPNINSYFMSFASKIIRDKQKIIPAVTHIDGTARFQTLTKENNAEYYDLINEFRKITGVPVLLNTSFNLNNEPIVETPQNAIDTFLHCDMDYLVIGNKLISKETNNEK